MSCRNWKFKIVEWFIRQHVHNFGVFFISRVVNDCISKLWKKNWVLEKKFMNLKLFTNRFKHDSWILDRECSGKYLYEYLRHILRSGLQRSGQDRLLFAPWQQLPPFTRFWGFFTSSTWMKNVTLPLLPWNKKKKYIYSIFQPNWEKNFEDFVSRGILSQRLTEFN